MKCLKPRPGIILPVVIALLVLIELLAVMILVAANQEYVVSTRRASIVQAQLAARSAASHMSLQHPVVQTLAPGRLMQVAYTAGSAREQVEAWLERLTSDLFVLRVAAEAGPPGQTARASVGLVLAAFDPQSALAQIPAALNTAGDLVVDGNSRIDGSSATQAPPGWSTAPCQTWLSLPDSTPGVAYAPGALAAVDPQAIVLGVPATEERSELAHPTPFDTLGSIELSALVAHADRVESGLLTLAPVAVAGRCEIGAPGNWGAPFDASHPCASYFPLVHAAGDLIITDGAGQGLLIVAGNLILSANVHFFGLALVGGQLHLAPGAVVEGAVRVQSGTSTLAGGQVRRSNCALTRALTQAPALNQLELRLRRAWIPTF